jgi:HD-GYP domain-containing protein (c-di-GMP phosphodiesterase class II)
MKLSLSDTEILGDAAQLHDVGKLLINDTLINKTRKFTSVELSVIQQHTIFGVRILTALLVNPKIVSIVHYHHEDWDGGGYPGKLIENEIPIGAQIIRVVDSYDAMTSIRGYKAAITHEQAMIELRAGRGKQYSPEVLDAFIEMQ